MAGQGAARGITAATVPLAVQGVTRTKAAKTRRSPSTVATKVFAAPRVECPDRMPYRMPGSNARDMLRAKRHFHCLCDLCVLGDRCVGYFLPTGGWLKLHGHRLAVGTHGRACIRVHDGERIHLM